MHTSVSCQQQTEISLFLFFPAYSDMCLKVTIVNINIP